MNSSRLRVSLAVAGVLTLLGLLSTSRMYFGYAELGHPISVADAVATGMMAWWTWAPLVPAIFALARRFALPAARLGRSLVVHAVASAAVAVLHIVLFGIASAAVREVRFGNGSFVGELRSSFAFKFNTGVVFYWAVLLACVAWDHASRSRVEALRRAELERSLTQARLAALQSHLAPHFLFNTLNAISAALHDEPDLAERMLARLGTLFRAVLDRRSRAVQRLSDELAFLDDYLELQRARFGERLTIDRRIDPAVLGVDVPTFLLLPLVENAVQHGVGARTGPATIRISADKSGASVRISIEDDGPGVAPADAADSRAFGLASVRERLRLIHGDAGRLEVASSAPSGAAIHVSFPA
ncbi:MAG: histidine kinase [Planctomycetes bacterium]|nr:histidine kinase [Planctomycetota bacterium]